MQRRRRSAANRRFASASQLRWLAVAEPSIVELRQPLGGERWARHIAGEAHEALAIAGGNRDVRVMGVRCGGVEALDEGHGTALRAAHAPQPARATAQRSKECAEKHSSSCEEGLEVVANGLVEEGLLGAPGAVDRLRLARGGPPNGRAT